MERVFNQLDSVRTQLLAAVERLDEKRFNQRPSDAEWSVGEVIHHLYLVEKAVHKQLEEALAKPPRKVGLLKQYLQVPPWIVGLRTIRVRAPKYVEPLNPPPKKQVLENFKKQRESLKALGQRHGRERLLQTFVKHPIFGDYDGIHAISFVGYHELRHFKQIKETIKKVV